jgi:UDP-glucuronate decarboxylase
VRPGHRRRRVHRLDISKANELLARRPTVPLRDGLRKTVEYFERLLQGKPSSP